MRLSQKIVLCAAVAGLIGCGAAPMVSAREQASTSDAAQAPRGFTLGAGDALGQHVFAHAVALARAQDTNGWRYADASGVGRAIYSSYVGFEQPVIAQSSDPSDTTWIFTPLFRGQDRSASASDWNFTSPAQSISAPSIIVLVPDVR